MGVDAPVGDQHGRAVGRIERGLVRVRRGRPEGIGRSRGVAVCDGRVECAEAQRQCCQGTDEVDSGRRSPPFSVAPTHAEASSFLLKQTARLVDRRPHVKEQTGGAVAMIERQRSTRESGALAGQSPGGPGWTRTSDLPIMSRQL